MKRKSRSLQTSRLSEFHLFLLARRFRGNERFKASLMFLEEKEFLIICFPFFEERIGFDEILSFGYTELKCLIEE